jgi:hypothetical protein
MELRQGVPASSPYLGTKAEVTCVRPLRQVRPTHREEGPDSGPLRQLPRVALNNRVLNRYGACGVLRHQLHGGIHTVFHVSPRHHLEGQRSSLRRIPLGDHPRQCLVASQGGEVRSHGPRRYAPTVTSP